jgi:hypothetical protein
MRDPLTAGDVDGRFPAPSGAAVAALLAGTALLLRSQLTHGFLAAALDGADLLFHEAGHPLFSVFGWRFLTILGGTLGQLAFPVLAAVVFARRRETASFAVAVIWIGFNLVNIGTYAADGEARLLPLVGADQDGHDWWNMLGALGLRSSAPGIGRFIRFWGWTLEAVAPAWASAAWLLPRLRDDA